MSLAVFLARREIVPHVLVHVRLVTIPAPAAVLICGYVDERIELESLQAFVSRARLPIVEIPMPEVEDMPFQEADFGPHGVMEGFSPGDISLSLAVIHVMAFHEFIETMCSRTNHRAIPAAKNTGVEKSVLVKKLAVRRPRKATCAGAVAVVEQMTNAGRRGLATAHGEGRRRPREFHVDRAVSCRCPMRRKVVHVRE